MVRLSPGAPGAADEVARAGRSLLRCSAMVTAIALNSKGPGARYGQCRRRTAAQEVDLAWPKRWRIADICAGAGARMREIRYTRAGTAQRGPQWCVATDRATRAFGCPRGMLSQCRDAVMPLAALPLCWRKAVEAVAATDTATLPSREGVISQHSLFLPRSRAPPATLHRLALAPISFSYLAYAVMRPPTRSPIGTRPATPTTSPTPRSKILRRTP